jgi:hypothetical protein
VKKTFLAASIALCLSAWVYAAGFSVPNLELSSIGRTENGRFTLHTRSYVDMAFEGGYKFGGKLLLNFNSGDIENAFSLSKNKAVDSGTAVNIAEKLNNSIGIGLKLISVEVRDFLSLPISLSYFVGDADVFGSGDAFPIVFGSASLATTLRGFSYFPLGIGGDASRFYDGISAVSGTGFKLATPIISGRFLPALYLYQDANLGTGYYSSDFRALFNFDKVKMDVFAGASFPFGKFGLYRAGLLFYYNTGTVGEFLAQIGMPYFNPGGTDPLNIDNFYFLFEPRLTLGIMQIIPTLFRHPAYYSQKTTNEKGIMDVNLNIAFGRVEKSGMRGGIEATVSFDSSNSVSKSTQLTLKVSPYFRVVTSGVYWDLKVSVLPFKYNTPMEMFEPYLGVKAGF